MAERRMFCKTIIDSDVFLDMPLSSQALYLHLSMRADDDGFVNNPRKIQRMIGASDDDLKILLAKRYILGFESGVIVIKHWRINNYIRNDRYKPTVYIEEKGMLTVKENGSYTEAHKVQEPIPIEAPKPKDKKTNVLGEYKSHYATIRNWARNDKAKEKGNKPTQASNCESREYSDEFLNGMYKEM